MLCEIIACMFQKEEIFVAGYDLSFSVKADMRTKVQEFLRYVQSIYKSNELEFHYKTSKLNDNKIIEVYIKIDGPLPAMQHTQRMFPEIFEYYTHVVTRAREVRNHIMIPFFIANKGGLKKITDNIFRISKELGGSPNPLAVSTTLSNKALSSGKKARESQVYKQIISAIDSWFSGSLSKKEVMILCDQAMEDWLKLKLSLPNASRKGFVDVLNEASNSGAISKMERYKLLRFHKARNRVQHRGGTIRSQTVNSMFKFYLGLLNRECIS